MDKIVLSDTIADKTQEVEAFFSMDNLRQVFNEFLSWITNLALQIILAVIVWKIGKRIIGWLVSITARAMGRSGLDVGVVKFVSSLVKAGAYAVLLLLLLDILGFQTTSLVAVFGSAALAVGMSLQGSLSNFAGGILLLLFRPFTIGDYIISGDCEGKVVSIDMLYTKLNTNDNKVIMMPNGALSNSNIINVGAEGIRRLDIEIGISYGSDVTEAKKVLRDVIMQYPSVDKEKEIQVFVKELSDSCVTLETRMWIAQEKYWDTRFMLLELYKRAFDKAGIEIPFNQLDVHIR